MAEKVIRSFFLREMVGRFKFYAEGGSTDEEAMRRALTWAIGKAKVNGWYDGPTSRAVDTRIAWPEAGNRRGASPKYPFWRMEVGETHLIEGAHKMDIKAAMRSFGHRRKMKFTAKDDPDGDGVFVTRIA